MLVFVLPVNWTGDQVEVLQQQQATGTATSNWTYWVPADVRVQEEEESGALDQSKPTVVEVRWKGGGGSKRCSQRDLGVVTEQCGD